MTLKARYKGFKAWLRHKAGDESGLAATEAALVFPILMTLLLGTFDLGNGILANQKTIRVSQVIADLITREMFVDDEAIDEAIMAGELAMTPMPIDTLGIDIVSVAFDDDGDAQVIWRETRNMSPSATALDDVAPLSDPGSGVVIVTVQYLFEPLFGGVVVNEIPMIEKAFARGRNSARVNRID